MKFKMLYLVLALLCLTGRISAQTPTTVDSMPGMVMETPGLIDGAMTPEQIPTPVIFREWLDNRTAAGNYLGHLTTILGPDDQAVVTQAFQYYASHRAVLNTAQQASVNAAAIGSQAYNRTGYWNGVYALVNTVWSTLESNMSAVGFLQFQTYLEEKKVHFHASPYDPGLGQLAQNNLDALNKVASSAGQGPVGMVPSYGFYADVEDNTSVSSYNFATFANGALPSSLWTPYTGAAAFVVSGGQVYGNGGTAANHWGYYISYGQYRCQSVTLGHPPTGGHFIGMLLSSDQASGSTWHGTDVTFNPTGVFVSQVSGSGATRSYLYGLTRTNKSGDGLVGCLSADQPAGSGHIHYVVYLLSSATGTSQLLYNGTAATGDTTGYMGLEGFGTATDGTISADEGVIAPSVWSTSQVTGDTICTGTACNGAIHQASAKNVFASWGGTVYGPKVTPQTATGATNIQTYGVDWFVGQPGVVFDLDASILCSVRGAFWSGVGNLGGIQIEAANTRWKAVNAAYNTTNLTPNCSDTGSPPAPPDFNMSSYQTSLINPVIPGNTSYNSADGFAPLCWRFTNGTKTPWKCHVGFLFGSPYAMPPKADCSYWDGGHPGPVILNMGPPIP